MDIREYLWVPRGVVDGTPISSPLLVDLHANTVTSSISECFCLMCRVIIRIRAYLLPHPCSVYANTVTSLLVKTEELRRRISIFSCR